jgi:GNAT superfamily N-acetyltransferase
MKVMKPMNQKTMIREALPDDRETLAKIIKTSFEGIARRFSLTPENCPKHPSNYTPAWVETDFSRGVRYFMLHMDAGPIGCVGLEQPNAQVCYLERLSVLPENRGRGFGKILVRHALEWAASKGAAAVGIGIIAEQTELGQWYNQLGFVETKTISVPHLPFNVCLMEFKLGEGS